MAGILKIHSRSIKKSLNNLVIRYFSNICKVSQARPFIYQNALTSFAPRHKEIVLSNELFYKEVSLTHKRNFRMSLILYVLIHETHCLGENKVVSTPPFPESVAEGDIRWEKGVGDTVNVDDIVCEVETDKTSIPVHAPVSGKIAERYVENGATVKAGQKLFSITIGPGGPPSAAESKPVAKPVAAVTSAPPPVAPKADVAVPAVSPRVPTSPRTSMPVAAIKHAQAIEAPAVRMPPADPMKEIAGTRSELRVKMTRMRQKIAQRLKEAQNTNAMLTTFNEIDMSSIMEFRKMHQDLFTKKHGVKLGFMSPFLAACAAALKEQPIVNAVIMDNEIVYRDYIDISVAVATPKGLVVPVIRNVESMSYGDIEKAISAVGEKARLGKLAVEDMDGGTFTVSNGGVFGSLMGTPIINPPQSAILGMHATFERPVAIKGQVVIRPMMYIALTYDHRLIDGREAVLFLRKIKAAVEDPRIIIAGI